MFKWAAFAADAVVVLGALYAIRRWKPFKWWFTLGYWFNAQAWGARDHVFGAWRGPSCWTRVLPASVCRAFAIFLLAKVEAPPEEDGIEVSLDHQMSEAYKVIESWNRISARHERRGWNHHPHGCYDPTCLRWCCQPNCEEISTSWVLSDRARYYCAEHHPMADSVEELAA